MTIPLFARGGGGGEFSDHNLVCAVQKNKLHRPNARVKKYASNVPWGTAYIYDDVDMRQ